MKTKPIKIDTTSPIEATRKNIRFPRFWIFLLLSLVTYGLMFFTLFGEFLLLRSMIYIMLFFLFFHFLYLELRTLPIKYLLFFMLLLTGIESIYIGYTSPFLLGSILAINMGIVYFAWFLQGESRDKRFFSSMAYFSVGGYMFTVFITIAYSLFIVGYYEKFPFTCESLSEASNSVIDYVTKPLKLGIDEAKGIKESTESFFSSKLSDVVSVSEGIDIKTTTEGPKFLERLSIYKAQLIDQTIEDNTKVNMGICDYVLGEINNMYSTPGVKASLIVLLFLLLYGFIRIEFWIMTGIAVIVFKLLFKINIYKTKQVIKEIEELE